MGCMILDGQVIPLTPDQQLCTKMYRMSPQWQVACCKRSRCRPGWHKQRPESMPSTHRTMSKDMGPVVDKIQRIGRCTSTCTLVAALMG